MHRDKADMSIPNVRAYLERISKSLMVLAIAICVAIKHSRGCIGRSPIEALLSSAPFCIPCLVARTGLRAWDVEIAMRALIRTSDVELAGICESCRTRPGFRARHRGTTGS